MAIIETSKYLSRLPVSIYGTDQNQDIHKVITIFSELVAELELIANKIATLRNYKIQSGAQLDLCGELVGEPRKSRNDNLYKLFIGIAIAKNNSSGLIEDINTLTELIPGADDGQVIETAQGVIPAPLDGSVLLDGTRWLRGEWYNFAAFEYLISGNVDSLYVPVELADAIDQIKSAGVNATLRARLKQTFAFSFSASNEMAVEMYLTEPVGSNKLDGSLLLDGDWLLDTTPEVKAINRLRGSTQILIGAP